MGWKDLLAKGNESVTLPWLGGRVLRSKTQTWTIEGPLPREHGWYRFRLQDRKALLDGSATDPTLTPERSVQTVRGYLVGDHMVLDSAKVNPDPVTIAQHAEPVYLIEAGLARFVRVAAGRIHLDGPLVFGWLEMPLGSEDAVQSAYLSRKTSVDHIPGVPPALDAAFRMESWQRAEIARRRAEAERLRREEEERLAKDARLKEMMGKLGDAVGRRAMALYDFGAAATAALLAGGAEYLDHRPSTHKNEMVVDYRVGGRNLQCVCAVDTLRIIDSGVCLTEHGTGIKGDTRFTLESLPSVILEAQQTHKLVVYRHVGGDPDDDPDDGWDD